AAYAVKLCDVQVISAYPITPQSPVVEKIMEFITQGEMNVEFVTVESEHSAMSACIGASVSGGRVMTATSANGLALMWEMLYIAAGNRAPIVMTIVNRALSAPINIHGDHSDSMGARDSGWIQVYCENAQETYDSLIQAIRIGQEKNVRLPVMVCMDGFIISHSIENIELFEDQEVKNFIGENITHYPILDTKNPVTYGPLDLQDYYSEHKRQQDEAMFHARDVILRICKEFEKFSGRSYGFFETHHMEDAEIGVLSLGSSAGTVRTVVEELRKKGIKAGMVKLRVFRPFPAKELADILSPLKALAVLDRCDSFGAQGGPVFSEVRSCLFDYPQRPKVINYIYGLGGRDLGLERIEKVFDDLSRLAKTGQIENLVDFLTVRE
ncbi:MAG: pyruvate ferredoxin oxidoreductase, partial [bacterium]